jgi:hypothetical protein
MVAHHFSTLQSDEQLKQGLPPVFADGTCLANDALAAPALTHLNELQAVAFELTRNKVDDLDLLHARMVRRWARMPSRYRSETQLELTSSSIPSAGPRSRSSNSVQDGGQRRGCRQRRRSVQRRGGRGRGNANGRLPLDC